MYTDPHTANLEKMSIPRKPVKPSMGGYRSRRAAARMITMVAIIMREWGMGLRSICARKTRNANHRRKSTLRMAHQEPLGLQYRGSRVGRDDLFASESDSSAGRSDSRDEEASDQDGLMVWDQKPSATRHGMERDESDQSHDSKVLGEDGQGRLGRLGRLGRSSSQERIPSGLRGKKDAIEIDDVDAFGSSGEGSEGEDENRMLIEGGSVDADTRFMSDDGDDAFNDEAAEIEETDSSSDEASSEHEFRSSMSDESDPNDQDERAILRQMMAESQKAVVATIAEASKNDVAKGEAIAHQRTAFDALLNTRIHLQKGIVAMNSLPSQDDPTSEDDTFASVMSHAEAAALRLWNGLEELRQAMQPSPPPTKKRLVSPPTHSTSTATIWDRMQSHEAQFIPTRRATLTKWSSRLQPLAVDRNRTTLSGKSDQVPLMTVLDQHLAAPNRARLLARTRVPRSCAPVQAATHIPSDPEIYDDADFYATLLRELVDRRMTDSSLGRQTSSVSGTLFNNNNNDPSSTSSLLPLARDRKPRGQVDTRASKGRKMRYTVHEKLQNFMAPEDRGSWGKRQTTELFAGLLGQKRVRMGEDKEDENERINGRYSSAEKNKNTYEEEEKKKKEEEEEEEAWMMFHRRRINKI